MLMARLASIFLLTLATFNVAHGDLLKPCQCGGNELQCSVNGANDHGAPAAPC
jgi:hypothetical protein